TLGIFYVEYAKSLMGSGYWDDRENGAVESFVDGDYLVPSSGFGAVVLGANGAYDADVVRFDQTLGRFQLSFEVGGGLGIGFVTGHMDRWTLDRTTGTTGWQLYEDGQPPTGKKDLKSPVWPVPDFQLGFKLNFFDHVVLRLEGGLHGALFFGGALGGRF